jgi:hypothetical protein
MKKLYTLLAAAALLATAGAANAAKPVPLSDVQMDRVTAGATGIANAGSVSIGDFTAETFSRTNTEIQQGVVAAGIAFSQGLAGSLLFQAFSASHADTAASLP